MTFIEAHLRGETFFVNVTDIAIIGRAGAGAAPYKSKVQLRSGEVTFSEADPEALLKKIGAEVRK